MENKGFIGIFEINTMGFEGFTGFEGFGVHTWWLVFTYVTYRQCTTHVSVTEIIGKKKFIGFLE